MFAILYLYMSLLEQRVVAVSGRVGDLRALRSALGSEALVENDAARPRLVVDEDLIAEFVDELIEAEVHLKQQQRCKHSRTE